MKNKLLFIVFLIGTVIGCSDEKLEEINEDLDNPFAVPVQVLLPFIETNTAYSAVGGDLSLYMAVHTQLVTGVHAQMHSFDRLVFSPSTFQNTWNSIYTGGLKNSVQMMEVARSTGARHYLGLGQILYAYNASIATDMWGRVPYSQAGTGEFQKPIYDMQEDIYTGEMGLIALLDSAIVNLGGTSTASPGSEDFIYDGDLNLWIKAAHGLKAKFITRLANTSAYDAQAVIDEVALSFVDNSEAFIFNAFGEGATNEHPWAQEENDRTHFASSQSLFDLMNAKNDPRVDIYFDDGAANLGAAPNGTAELDQGGDLYDKIYDYVEPDSPLEFLTFDQLKFYEAEAYLNLGQTGPANTSYEAAVTACLQRYGVDAADITTYTTQPNVFPGAGSLTSDDIHEQLYLSFYPFQSQEAFAMLRRTDHPVIVNPNGAFLQRLPYPQVELDNNAENNPGTPVTNGVWWDDGSDD